MRTSRRALSNQADTPPQRIRWTPEMVNRFWNGFSKTRLVEYSFSRQAGRSLLVAIDHLLPKKGRILDFGAGDGDLVRLMSDRGLRAAAYEPSESRSQKLIEKLQRCLHALGIEGLYSKAAFDVVLLVEVLEHIIDEQLEDQLNRLKAFTKDGGLIIVTVPNNEDLDLGMAYCPVSNLLFHRWQHVRSFTAESLVQLMASHGFQEVVTHHVEFIEPLFVPFDRLWGDPDQTVSLPSHIVELRANRAARIGGETNLLYIGRRVS